MEAERAKLRSEALPHKLAEVFRLLRTGRHVCVEDGANYRSIEQEEDRYRTVLEGLGYDLVHHAQGFYYLKGGRTFSSRALQSITLFAFLLFQHLEDNKQGEPDHSWIRSLTTRRFVLAELPHFGTVQNRTMMANLDLTAATLRPRVLRVLQQLGMLEFIDDSSFRFRSPIYRFIDLCMSYAEETWEEATPNVSDDNNEEVNEDDANELGGGSTDEWDDDDTGGTQA